MTVRGDADALDFAEVPDLIGPGLKSTLGLLEGFNVGGVGIGVSVGDVDFVEGGGVVSRRALVLNAYLDDDVKFDVSIVTETVLFLRASNVELCFPTGNDLYSR